MLTFGGLIFHVSVVSKGPLRQHSMHVLGRVVLLGAAAVIAGSLLQLLLQAVRLGGLDTLTKLTLGTRTGVLALARMLLALSGLLASTGLARNAFATPLPRILVALMSARRIGDVIR
jgi:hypothetical protein